MFFAFRFNFNMSQDPDSMQSPEQVSDFDGDAWFLRSRRSKFASLPCILYEPPYILAILKFKFRPARVHGRVFFSEFLYGGDRSFYE